MMYKLDIEWNFEDFTTGELTALQEQINEELAKRANIARINSLLARAFKEAEAYGLNIVDQETAEVFEYGRLLAQ